MRGPVICRYARYGHAGYNPGVAVFLFAPPYSISNIIMRANTISTILSQTSI